MSGEEDGARRGRPIDPYVDEALRTATMEIISKSGWRGATIERIAERAGVARTTIYRRHGSVHGVLGLLLDELFDRAPVPDTGTLRSDLTKLMCAVVESWRDPAFADFVCAMLAALRESTELTDAYRTRAASRRVETRRIVERAIDRGELPADADGDLLLDIIMGLGPQRLLFTGVNLNDADIPRIIDTVLVSFAARAAD